MILSAKRALIFLLASSAAAAGAQTRLRAWNIHAEGYPVTEAMKWFAGEVAKATEGRYQVDVHSGGVLGDQPKAVQMLKTGELDLAEFSLGPLSEAAPGTKALNLPFLFTDSRHMLSMLDGALGRKLEDRLKASGYKVLGWYDGGARSFYCTHRQVARVGDFKGLKIRVQQSDVYIRMVKALEATPVVLPFKDVLAALQDGSIDCAENNLPALVSTEHYKVARYVYLTNHVISPEALVMSVKAWDRLDGKDQQAFAAAGRKSAELMRQLWGKRADEAREVAARAGVQFTRVSDYLPLVRRMSVLHGEYMADPQTRDEVLTILGTGATR